MKRSLCNWFIPICAVYGLFTGLTGINVLTDWKFWPPLLLILCAYAVGLRVGKDGAA